MKLELIQLISSICPTMKNHVSTQMNVLNHVKMSECLANYGQLLMAQAMK
jgi:collagenase-like PrtC family protease